MLTLFTATSRRRIFEAEVVEDDSDEEFEEFISNKDRNEGDELAGDSGRRRGTRYGKNNDK